MRRSLIFVLLLLFWSATPGCYDRLLYKTYITSIPKEIEPEYNFFKKGNLKVVVVCRSQKDQVQDATVPSELAKRVSLLLQENVKNKKFQVVDQPKVEAWLAESNYSTFEDLSEVGAEFQADYVIAIELQSYRTDQTPKGVQSRASWIVKTYDVKKNKLVAEKQMKRVFPPGVPLNITSQAGLEMFQNKVVDLISQQIAGLYSPQKIMPMGSDLLEL